MLQLTRRSIQPVTAGTPQSNADNIRSALARGLSEFTYPAPFFHDGNIVIVGSGPSLPDFLESIREEKRKGRPICAIKGAHDWLIDNGIQPDLFVSCEPRERPLKHVSETCCYLIASRCSPALLDQLQGKRVILWHSVGSKTGSEPPVKEKITWDDCNLEDECEAFRDKPIALGGGSTSGLRAMTIAYQIFGFRNMTLYGFDSCLAPDRKTKRFTGEDVGNGLVVDVIVAGKRFWCNGAMAVQASEFQDVINSMPGLKLDVKGDGLLAAIMSSRRAKA